MPPRVIFADAFYWVALLDPADSFHARVVQFSRTLGTTRLLTTDEVLTEVLNWFSRGGPYWRKTAASLIRAMRNDPGLEILPQTRTDFDDALTHYESRPDKGYSLTDCRSMLAMRGLGITEVLTNDRHFTQEGFTILFP